MNCGVNKLILILFPIWVFSGKGFAAEDERAMEREHEMVRFEGFENCSAGSLPDDFFILEGNFAVCITDKGKCLQQDPFPVGEHGFMFGPRLSGWGRELAFSFLGRKKGRRHPAFVAALGGARGIKLRLNPVSRLGEIYFKEQRVHHFPLPLSFDGWMRARIQAKPRQESLKTLFRFKLWPAEAEEPVIWNASTTIDGDLPQGRCMLSGIPYSEEPILWDDLTVITWR